MKFAQNKPAFLDEEANVGANEDYDFGDEESFHD